MMNITSRNSTIGCFQIHGSHPNWKTCEDILHSQKVHHNVSSWLHMPLLLHSCQTRWRTWGDAFCACRNIPCGILLNHSIKPRATGCISSRNIVSMEHESKTNLCTTALDGCVSSRISNENKSALSFPVPSNRDCFFELHTYSYVRHAPPPKKMGGWLSAWWIWWIFLSYLCGAQPVLCNAPPDHSVAPLILSVPRKPM